MSSATADVHVHVRRVPLAAGGVLLLARVNGALLVADGFLADDPIRALAGAVHIPAASWPGVAVAVGELLAGADGER
jgi:hypothetical protein